MTSSVQARRLILLKTISLEIQRAELKAVFFLSVKQCHLLSPCATELQATPSCRAVVRPSAGARERFRLSGEREDLNTSKRATCSALRVREGDCFVSFLDRGSRGVVVEEEEERIMSYSCTSTGNSQDPSCSKKSGGVNPGSCSSSGDTGNGNNRHSIRGGKANSNPDLSEAMKVKKGCNTADVGVPVTTEEELLANETITPEDVLGLQKITES
ncbi:uncharacterized protein [Sinocyclocheilus grahami]|uniref:uncharacterized protein isoform X2 n=1 Tax=Sinocyclocheilus grahami TaxID=75366 RepID=UPI0007AD079F|nr:PREDICTED: uncharacterized protein LOC107587222 isoform X2 [Sinocyclocheilus grahami]